jgi:hypothetical protein
MACVVLFATLLGTTASSTTATTAANACTHRCRQQHTFQQPPPQQPSTTNNVSVVSAVHARNFMQIFVHDTQLQFGRNLKEKVTEFSLNYKNSILLRL